MKFEAAIIGLIGVIIGAFLATLKDWWFHRVKKKEDQTYLAIQISCLLERFSTGCLEVAYDDGRSHGQPDEHGYLSPQVKTPDFEPLSVDVNWKSLPTSLMYQILRLPSKIDDANAYISAASEYAASPPNFEEFFEARVEKYSELGLLAIELVEELRELAKFPADPSDDDWNPKARLKEAYDGVRAEISARNLRNQITAKQMAEQFQPHSSDTTNEP